jgi:DNA repair exonuclease SbcCD ATPase subunit
LSKILFKKIRWKNFISTGNSFIEIDLSNPKATLVIGKNGAGKSQLLDAVSFALFNKPFRNINKPDLVNTITDKDCVVEIEFIIGGHEFKVMRGVKPNLFEIWKDGELLNQDAEQKDYQDAFEKYVLKINHKSFCQVVILGSAVFTPFMSLPKQSKREIIEDLLDLQIFTRMNNLLKVKTQQTDFDIYQAENEKKIIEEKLKLTYDHIREVQQHTEKQIAEKMDRIRTSEETISQFESNIQELQSSKERLETGLEKDWEDVTTRLNNINTLNAQLAQKLQIVSRDVTFFTDNNNCPTCTQDIDETFKTKTLAEKGSHQVELQEGLEALKSEQQKYAAKHNILRATRNDISIKTSEIHQNKTKISNLLAYIDELKADIESAKNTVVTDVQKPVELEQQLAVVEKNLKELNELRTMQGFAGSMLKDDGIKSKIIKSYIPIINQFLNKYCAILDFFVDFQLDESFKETIKSRFRDTFSYESFSQGEKMRLDLAVMFTWRAIAKMRNSVDCSLIIFDEILDGSMDIEGIDNTMKLLDSISPDTSIFIISHRDQVSDKFEQTIQFEKHKNFSRLV